MSLMDPHVHCPLLHTEDWLFKAGTGHSQGTHYLALTHPKYEQ